MDIFIVRKLGVPGNEELAMGAIASNDIRVLNETSLGTSLIENLSLSVTFRLNYDSQPPDDIKYLDTSIKTGVVMKY